MSRIARLALTATLLAGLSVPAWAGYVGPSDRTSAASVAAILKNPVDDQRVTLQGYILREIGSDLYVFSDGTGEINADINHKRFPPQPIGEKTRVEIQGKVDTHRKKAVDIDVHKLTVLE